VARNVTGGAAAPPDWTPADTVVFTSVVGQVTALLGDAAPTTSGGIGGWEAVARHGREPLTIYRGPAEPLKAAVAILLDGFDEGDEGASVEPEIAALERMGGLGADDEPALVYVTGIPHDGDAWVIESIEWGDCIRRPSDGRRVRQAAVVNLARFREDETLRRIKPRRSAPKYRHVRARQGDTFEKVAARELGTRRLGARLARLNGKRSPDVKLKAGHRVRVPAGDLLKSWKRDLKRRR